MCVQDLLCNQVNLFVAGSNKQKLKIEKNIHFKNFNKEESTMHLRNLKAGEILNQNLIQS